MSRSNGEVVVIAVETGDSRSKYRKGPGKKKKKKNKTNPKHFVQVIQCKWFRIIIFLG